MTIEPEQNVERQQTAVSLLVDHFQNKENFVALLSSYTEQTQELENTFFDLFNGFALDTAIGAQLDALGEIVGAERNGAPDEVYRLRVRAHVLLNTSSGTPNQLLTMAELLGAPDPHYTPRYPAGFELSMLGTVSEQALADEVADIVSQGAPTGVHYSLLFSLSPEDELFSFSSQASVIETSTQTGLSDTSQLTGGRLSAATGN